MTNTFIANILVNASFLGTAAMAVDYFEKTISQDLWSAVLPYLTF